MIELEEKYKDNEDQMVCICKRVSYRTIRDAVKKGSNQIELVRAKTKANTGCSTHCTEEVMRIIKEFSK